ncbi:unnamed protein product [Schistocephalus solidus]|uniref:NADH dehydrogenase [ubiquinone] 1 beta subcomplex subunit 11, mitochondrial n=1 Tax=Schistocephalus solidus TaxID=70667 RepID=A0A183T3L7_SCHSO|nr:unnamed protein product [Schistocephalus solidus]
MAFQSVVRAILPRLRVSPSNFSPVQIRLLSTSQVNCSGGPSFKHILNHNDLSDDTKKQIESEVRDTLKVYVHQENEWARREAFLELERRRLLGLPLVDPNLIPPERVKLPSKEELGPDYKIII